MTTDGGFSCTTCGGECSVETGRRGAPQIKCHDCGAQFDVILAPLPRAKWTLVGPSGKLASFSSAEALRDAVERTVEFGTSESQALQLPNPPSSEDLIAATPAPAPAPTPPPEPSASAALAAIEIPARVLPLTEQEDGEEEEEMRVETKEIVVV